MVENFDKMLAGSLRLEDPWYIIGAEFNEEEPAIHIHVGVYKTAALCCPVCGAPTKRYGYEPKELSGVMRTACFIPVMSTASVPVFSATNAVPCR